MTIDRKKIIDSLSKLEIWGNAEGMIPAFNLLINQMPANFWARFEEMLTRRMTPDLLPAAELLLVNAAHECGYHTGHGIITSEEWKAVVAPMVERIPEDILHGTFAVVAALGWANAVIEELEPGHRMVFRAYNYYEADLVSVGAATKFGAYLLQGIGAGFMDLVYGGPYDPTGKTGLRTFVCVQTKGLEHGDPYAEFIVKRA